MNMPYWPDYGSDVISWKRHGNRVAQEWTCTNRLDGEYPSHIWEWLRAKRPMFGSRQGEVNPNFTKTTVRFRPIQSLVKFKSAHLSHAARQLKNEVETPFLPSLRLNISGAVLARPILLHAVVFRLYAV